MFLSPLRSDFLFLYYLVTFLNAEAIHMQCQKYRKMPWGKSTHNLNCPNRKKHCEIPYCSCSLSHAYLLTSVLLFILMCLNYTCYVVFFVYKVSHDFKNSQIKRLFQMAVSIPSHDQLTQSWLNRSLITEHLFWTL